MIVSKHRSFDILTAENGLKRLITDCESFILVNQTLGMGTSDMFNVCVLILNQFFPSCQLPHYLFFISRHTMIDFSRILSYNL